jgi:hypothetical protein
VPNTYARKALHAYLSEHAHEQWHEFAAHEGVSVSAILEAMAPALSTGGASPDSAATVGLDEVIGEARRIDARRRRRRR